MLAEQQRDEAADAVDHATKVDIQQALPAVGADLPTETGLQDAGVVEQQVDAAEALHRQISQGIHLGRIAHVGHPAHDRHALPLQLFGEGRQALPIDVGQYQAQSPRPPFFRQAAAYAACRTGDHRHLALFDSHG
ncbi:hypothetical protein D9M68_782590 [compost metagenome]